ncbi:TPA: hypothetical protein U1C40_001631 [Streptococcus suis]|nr:hypothetical protein [Streptococcus suis]
MKVVANQPFLDAFEWEHGIGTTMTFSHQEMAIYLLFPMWEEVENDTENPDLVEELT